MAQVPASLRRTVEHEWFAPHFAWMHPASRALHIARRGAVEAEARTASIELTKSLRSVPNRTMQNFYKPVSVGVDGAPVQRTLIRKAGTMPARHQSEGVGDDELIDVGESHSMPASARSLASVGSGAGGKRRPSSAHSLGSVASARSGALDFEDDVLLERPPSRGKSRQRSHSQGRSSGPADHYVIDDVDQQPQQHARPPSPKPAKQNGGSGKSRRSRSPAPLTDDEKAHTRAALRRLAWLTEHTANFTPGNSVWSRTGH